MQYDGNKSIRLSRHAQEQCQERGATEDEVKTAIIEARWAIVRDNRFECKYSFQFNALWGNKYYAIKEVRPIFVEEDNEIVVITIYTYYN
ncbi:MAG: hypothetical protein JWO03_3361 [Bacteroidetes bacterium]|nr:hypothetical protein [Bacteroidota bacterium]